VMQTFIRVTCWKFTGHATWDFIIFTKKLSQ
jgi:hypothetical protein